MTSMLRDVVLFPYYRVWQKSRYWSPAAASAREDQTGGSAWPKSAANEVMALPGWSGALPSRHYSGFIEVAGGTRELHYYLQEADEAPSSKPLILWLNGGPGETSLFGAFTELGQLVFNRDSSRGGESTGVPQLFRNPHSWTRVANVLYLETPAGVGFSRCIRPSAPCNSDDTSTARHNADFLFGFVRAHPEYVNRAMYFTGESYAGMYLPMLIRELDARAAGGDRLALDLRGTAIGNGCWGTSEGTNCGDLTGSYGLVYKTDVEYFFGRGVIGAALKRSTDAACGDWREPLSARCLSAYANVSKAIGRLHIDHVDDHCEEGDAATLAEQRGPDRFGRRRRHRAARVAAMAAVDATRWPVRLLERTFGGVGGGGGGGGGGSGSSSKGGIGGGGGGGVGSSGRKPGGAASSSPPSAISTAEADAAAPGTMPPLGEVQTWCGAEAAFHVWMRVPAVVAALNAPPPSASPPAYNYTVEVIDLRRDYAALAARPNHTLLIYSGTSDANVPYLDQLDAWMGEGRVARDWEPWYLGRGGEAVHGGKGDADGLPYAGHVRTYTAVDGAPPFHFVKVHGAGHEVPTYRPRAALEMLKAFLLGPGEA